MNQWSKALVGAVVAGFLTTSNGYADETAAPATTETAPAVLLRYGVFLSAVVDFLIISFSIFIAIKIANKIARIPIASTAVPK